MKYQLLKPINLSYSTIEQVLVNRGIDYNEVFHYLNSTDADINKPEALGEDKLKTAAQILIKHISQEDKILVIIDCDCDGFTSSALLINYLHDLFPAFVENNLFYEVHEGKEHGLSDIMEYIRLNNFGLVIVPDAGSNDIECHKEIIERGGDVIILDHHIVDKESPYGITINNQLGEYPNKELSGVGVTWQFCRYLDKQLKQNFADYYLDLVALGLTGDMMSLTSIETKHLINKGFEPNNIHNPYIYEMWQKNKFKLGEYITSIDAAFYIVPMVNAVQRSGTIEEKILLFKSMLKHNAFQMILSNKRGHKDGEEERLVDQAVRMSTNVKNRQTRAQDAIMEELEQKIEEDDTLKSSKILIFLLHKNQIDRNIAGLIANKIANKYQKPCLMLIQTEIQNEDAETELRWQGSARGYEMTGVANFKSICDECGAEWTAGHENAFGISLKPSDIDSFLEKSNQKLSNISTEPIYYVDYIYNGADVWADNILSIANLKSLWGKDFNEPYIAIKGLKVSKDMVTVYRKANNTLKITLSNKITLMKFNATDEECAKLENHNKAYLELDIVGTCNVNEWMGNITPQIFIENYEIVDCGKYLF